MNYWADLAQILTEQSERYNTLGHKSILVPDGCCLPQRPSAANSYYNPLAVRVHPPVPASGVLHGMVAIFSKVRQEISIRLLATSSVY